MVSLRLFSISPPWCHCGCFQSLRTLLSSRRRHGDEAIGGLEDDRIDMGYRWPKSTWDMAAWTSAVQAESPRQSRLVPCLLGEPGACSAKRS